MFLRMESMPPTRLVGMQQRMSVAENRTAELWQSFMPRRHEVQGQEGSAYFSLQIYDDLDYFRVFDPAKTFVKWAGVKVGEAVMCPEGMSSLLIEGGRYAVFQHRGRPSDFPATMQYIFSQWLPASDYVLDHREHFELLGDKYKNNHPDSEEEVWIPVSAK